MAQQPLVREAGHQLAGSRLWQLQRLRYFADPSLRPLERKQIEDLRHFFDEPKMCHLLPNHPGL